MRSSYRLALTPFDVISEFETRKNQTDECKRREHTCPHVLKKRTQTPAPLPASTPIPLGCALILRGEGGLGGPPAPPSLHLLRCLCHRGLLLHFNDKVAEPVTLHPHSPANSFQLFYGPQGQNICIHHITHPVSLPPTGRSSPSALYQRES